MQGFQKEVQSNPHGCPSVLSRTRTCSRQILNTACSSISIGTCDGLGITYAESRNNGANDVFTLQPHQKNTSFGAVVLVRVNNYCVLLPGMQRSPGTQQSGGMGLQTPLTAHSSLEIPCNYQGQQELFELLVCISGC